jgi:hypothetical protein
VDLGGQNEEGYRIQNNEDDYRMQNIHQPMIGIDGLKSLCKMTCLLMKLTLTTSSSLLSLKSEYSRPHERMRRRRAHSVLLPTYFTREESFSVARNAFELRAMLVHKLLRICFAGKGRTQHVDVGCLSHMTT